MLDVIQILKGEFILLDFRIKIVIVIEYDVSDDTRENSISQ